MRLVVTKANGRRVTLDNVLSVDIDDMAGRLEITIPSQMHWSERPELQGQSVTAKDSGVKYTGPEGPILA